MLEGIRVIDLSREPGFLAGKILAELGADVIKVEPPGGDRVGRRAPYLGGQEDPERSLAWLALNTSKRGITLDLVSEAGRGLLERLSENADVVLESFAPSERRALDLDTLRRGQPRLVHCSITPFGSSGPRAEFAGHDLVIVAMGGNAALSGDPDRAPLRCSMPSAYYHAGPEAALGVLMALQAREASGRGQHVDVSLQECQLQTLLGAPAMFAAQGRASTRAGARIGRTREIWPARDGYITFGLRGGRARARNLDATVEWMHESGMAPEWLRKIDWAKYRHQDLSAQEIERLESAFGAFFRSNNMRELYEGALARRILLAPCNDAREILEHPQLRDREFFVDLDYPEFDAHIEHPLGFARTRDQAIRVRSRAPRIGEHNAEVFAELGLGADELSELRVAGVI